MSTADQSADQQAQEKYYDPAEVEAYVKDVTSIINSLQARLQEASRRAERAERAERGLGEHQPESLGRALLLAGEVADKTIADADVRAAEIVRAAEERAAGIIEAANVESRRLVDTAGGAAAEMFQKGEARLLAAVSAFVEGSTVLRTALARIEEDATSWRRSSQPPPPSQPPERPPPTPPVLATRNIVEPFTDVPGRGVYDRAPQNGYHPAHPDPPVADKSPPVGDPNPEPPPFTFPPPPAAGAGDGRPGGTA